jgi:hypothetical protein
MFSRADKWLNIDHPGKYPMLVALVIQESRVKKVLVDGGSSINVTFPRTLQALGISTTDLTQSDTPFFGIMLTKGITDWDISIYRSSSAPRTTIEPSSYVLR